MLFKTQKTIYLVLVFLFSNQCLSGQIIAGDIAIIGYNTDSPDGFAFITLKTIPSGQSVYFTDEGVSSATAWQGNTEDHWLFTPPAGGIPIGTIISIEDLGTPNVLVTGAPTGATYNWQNGGGTPGNFNLSAGDQILIYTVPTPGIPASPSTATFIGGLHGDYDPSCYDAATKWNQIGCTSTSVSKSVEPAGLTNGVNCVSLYPGLTEQDNAKYNGTLSGSAAFVLSEIMDYTNWITDNSSSYDINPSDFPSTNVVLPIELLSFSATCIDPTQVDIEWTTATEVNNHYFTVERSLDNKSWESIAELEGAGYSNQRKNYSFSDLDNPAGLVFYRLKQTDFDGAFTYSEVKTIKRDSKALEFAVYPNPTSDLIYIEGPEQELNQIDLYTILGQKITSVTEASESIMTFDLSALETGIYLLRSASGNTKRVYKK